MHWDNKILWPEGMFLRPQHFQQFERYVEKLARQSTQALSSLGWEFTTLEIDEALLKIGVVALSRASGILPDGTPFDIPDDDDHPTPLEPASDLRGAVIHLALPTRRPGAADSSLTGDPDTPVRWVGEEVEAPDTILGSTTRAALLIGKRDFRLLHQQQELAGYVTLPFARLIEKRLDGSLSLDREFVATALSCDAAPNLRSYLAEIRGLLQHRGSAIAARLTSTGGKTTAELSDFLVLMLVNRNEAVLRHLASLPNLHPEALYRQLSELAGELATFTETATHRPPNLPEYRHADLAATFRPLMTFLREALSAIFEQTAIPIELELRPYGIRVGRITDASLFNDCTFVLAAKSTVEPETLRANLPKRTTIGPVERIRDLVNLQLSGVPIRPLPAEPRQIPFRQGMIYFEINTEAPDWKLVAKSGGVAVHVSGDVPDLTLELWAIRGRVR